MEAVAGEVVIIVEDVLSTVVLGLSAVAVDDLTTAGTVVEVVSSAAELDAVVDMVVGRLVVGVVVDVVVGIFFSIFQSLPIPLSSLGKYISQGRSGWPITASEL